MTDRAKQRQACLENLIASEAQNLILPDPCMPQHKGTPQKLFLPSHVQFTNRYIQNYHRKCCKSHTHYPKSLSL